MGAGTARAKRPFHIDAWVILPEHMHCLSTLPDSDADFVGRWWAIKTAFSKSLPRVEARSAVRIRHGARRLYPSDWAGAGSGMAETGARPAE